MQLPIQSGVRVANGSFSLSFPINLEHRLIESGVSKGQLLTTRGALTRSTGPGIDRGGINWNGVLYRAMGSKLVRVDSAGAVAVLGDIGTDDLPCSFSYSFDRLAVRSAESLFYWNGTTLAQVTDPDLGRVLDVAWIDGYFATTDGEFLVVTELLDPASVDALKYGSAEADPDPITGVLPYREELYALGRYTIQVFRNVGGLGFPFSVVKGATIPYGCVSARAKCHVVGAFAFVGGGRDEPIGVFLATQGTALRLSNREIDDMLAKANPDTITMESRAFGDEEHLIVHLDDRSLVLPMRASQAADAGLWCVVHSGRFDRYRPRGGVYCYGEHWVGDVESTALGTLSRDVEEHFGAPVEWQFDAGLLFNEGTGVILHDIELFGQFPLRESSVFLSMTRNGEVWSNEIARRLSGKRGERVAWRPNVRVDQIAGFRFRGAGKVAVARVDVRGEALAV